MMTLLIIAGCVLALLSVLAGVSTMTLTHSVSVSEGTSSGSIQSTKAVSVTGDAAVTASPSITASTNNVEVQVSFTVSRLKGIYICSDKTVTLYTNNPSGSSPDDTFTITADKPFVWYSGSGITCPIVGDSGAVDTLYISNANNAAAVVDIRVVKDATP
jgi:hypothetical protein